MSILWTIIIGFIAGVIAKFIMLGDNEPSGFILTTILGIVGAFVASYLGEALGWYRPGEGAGLIGAIVGAMAGSAGLATLCDYQADTQRSQEWESTACVTGIRFGVMRLKNFCE